MSASYNNSIPHRFKSKSPLPPKVGIWRLQNRKLPNEKTTAVLWSATFRQEIPGREIGHFQTTDGTPIKRLGGALLKVKSETKRRLMYLVNLGYFELMKLQQRQLRSLVRRVSTRVKAKQGSNPESCHCRSS